MPLQQNQELDAALRKAGVESTLIVVPGAGHGGPAFGSPENVARMGISSRGTSGPPYDRIDRI